jgi:hypothetical protein
MSVVDWVLIVLTLSIGILIGTLISEEKKQSIKTTIKTRLSRDQEVGAVKKLTPAARNQPQIAKDTEEAMAELIETKILNQ